jgi:prepilin peptidase CpaA
MTMPDAATAIAMPLAIMLMAAVWRDVRCHRIDNWITFSGALAALVLHATLAGGSGLLYALGGLGVGLVALLPFHAYGGMAAGDVKLMAAAGAFLGPLDALLAVATTLAAGSALALGVLAARGGLREGLGHIGRQLAAGSLTGVWVPAAPGTAAAQRFPYAAAIAFGALAIAAWRWLHMTPGGVG